MLCIVGLQFFVFFVFLFYLLNYLLVLEEGVIGVDGLSCLDVEIAH